ncbi:MAG: copper chaperone PCu(A)C [Geodermatophilaceae bacterium]|nr:copper chaperone PCu(A)C [Geodermatophilaceae bacterium]
MTDERGPRPRRTALARVLVASVAVLLVAGTVALGRDAPAASAITVYDAYVREPATEDVAAAYFAIRNDGNAPDRLLSVDSGAAGSVGVHDLPGAAGHETSEPLTIGPGQTVRLGPGDGHVMLESPVSPILPGQQVTLLLRFEDAGQLLVSAPVIAIGAEPPGGRQ